MNKESIIVRCNNCGTKNRIAKHRLRERPVCGRCKAPISIGTIYDRPVDINDKTFDSEVLSFPGPVLVDAWAPWCGPCRIVGPVLEQLAKEYAGRIKIAKLNVDENPQISSRYSIRSIPTMMIFDNGEKVNTLVGALPKEEIKRHLQPLL